MKVRVEEIANLEETEVVVRCEKRDGSVDKIVGILERIEDSLLVRKEGRSYRVVPPDILYFESVDDKVFVYTSNDVYETTLRLYELEDFLRNTTFLRVNKNTIVDSAKIVSFRPILNGRMEARLQNGESVEISRSYVGALKSVLGGKRP